MQFVRHPFVERDIIGIAEHIVEVTGGDTAAAFRRMDEIDALLAAIRENPTSGIRLTGKLEGWLVRHGGSGRRLTMVFRPDMATGRIWLALIAFGGRDWMRQSLARSSFAD